FKNVHGTDAAPPHNYVAAYLWARYGFGADALMHFGAHGSLEFTPRKQAALGSDDWPDRLVGTMPHIYVYSTSNVGEAMIAKRRSYAGIVNYLTPPFMESEVRGIYKNLTDAINDYNRARTQADSLRASRLVRQYTLNLGIHRELRIDSTARWTPDDIARIENFAEELANEKITGALYVMGQPYSERHIASTVEAMAVDPIAYSLKKLRGGDLKEWRRKALDLVRSGAPADDAAICRLTGLTAYDIDSAQNILNAMEGSRDMLSRMMVMGAMMQPKPQAVSKISERPATRKTHGMIPGMSADKAIAMARKMGADDEAIEKMKAAMQCKSVAPAAGGKASSGHPGLQQPALTADQIEFATAVGEVRRALGNISRYRAALTESPASELASIVNALNGGFTAPTSGGDPVLNPDILPTGRNMFAVNAEETPSAVAWEKGKDLAEGTIAMYRKAHGDSIPRKVSYTLWSSEFIETEGATIAQILYMLGVEPVRDPFGRVTDLRLIPSEELGRPRIDVVVQTSGQLRDLAASRLFLISRAVKMAAAADDDKYPNYVAEGVVESERHLVDRGVSPKEARSLSTSRVFGGVGGNYGTGIQSMVEAGDRWDDASEIAAAYIR
ncbi:MAG: cobaltochelatase subunit CobN, partial [Paramuribaculum sp.]|nr:cobaltochelatase subunit CobN [Paramuribaculum sp.]